MTTYEPAKRATAFVFGVTLWSQATSGSFQANPTLAAGDVKISKDGGAFANLTNLPTVNPAAGKRVEVSLTATEMTADNVTVIFSDAAGAEWYDLAAHIATVARQIDDLAFPATSGRSMVVDASGLVDANAVKLGPTGAGTAQTARDVGASVLLSTGTGTGQLDFTAGIVKANLAQILGTALTETAGLLAGGFKKFFNVASPTFTALSVNQTGDNFTRLGAPAGASVSADIVAVKGDTAAVKVQTDKLTFTVANQVDSNVKSNAGTAITAAAGVQEVKVASIATDAIGSAELAASAITEIQTGLSTLDAAAVKAQVVAALNTDTYAEPAQGAPAATATLAYKLGIIYKFLRNKKTQTASQLSIFNDDAVTVDHKAATSDDGTTFTSAEIASGP